MNPDDLGSTNCLSLTLWQLRGRFDVARVTLQGWRKPPAEFHPVRHLWSINILIKENARYSEPYP